MTFKWRRVAREHMKREHSVDKFFCIIAGSGVKQRTVAGMKHHYKEVHDHGAGEQQALEEPEDLEGPGEHRNRVHQGIKRGPQADTVRTHQGRGRPATEGPRDQRKGARRHPTQRGIRPAKTTGDTAEQQASKG